MPQVVGREVGKIGYGLMGLTWKVYGELPPQEQCFAAMRAALAAGANCWNGGQIYGTPERNSLHLLSEYFAAYPDDAHKIVLSIKGGTKPGTLVPDGSAANIRQSIDECLRVLGKGKKIDIFECARVDRDTPIEETIETIAQYVKEGKIGGVALSEVNANTIRRAAKVHKIEAVEVEFSMFETSILKNGVAAACAELNIPIIAYSPIGRGFLTGKFQKGEDLPEGDVRKGLPRFKEANMKHNQSIVQEVEKLASKKQCTPAQIAISWIVRLSGTNGLPTIIPIPGSTQEARVLQNSDLVPLDDSEAREINEIVSNFTVAGARAEGPSAKLLEG